MGLVTCIVGAFHMWEEMQAPIVPFVILGAYDLYPVGSWVNQTGVVTVRYLPPILPSAAKNRDHMMRMVG
jgi:1-acyl-sn-glycerol-3-phosphate acyltransferase